MPRLLNATGVRKRRHESRAIPIRSTLASANTGTGRARTRTSVPNRAASSSMRVRSSSVENRLASGRPKIRTSQKANTAPAVMPHHEAAAPPQKPKTLPANILTTLEGTGRTMSAAKRPTTMRLP